MDFIMFLGVSLSFFLAISLASGYSNISSNLSYAQVEDRNDQSFIIRKKA